MMDFLDPKKTRTQTIKLLLGYVLVAIAVALAATILLYIASGFNLKQGKVVQNGLAFVSSSPGGASIHLNDVLQNSKTNSRLVLQSGTYTMRLSRDGYRDWQRALTVEGGSITRFDYPLLIPNELVPTAVNDYTILPPVVTQSPDRQWLLVQVAGQAASFDMYNLSDSEQVAANKTTVLLPVRLLNLAQTGDQVFEVAEWSRDNNHVLLKHRVGDQFEYIVFSRDKPEESVNLTQTLSLTPTMSVTLQDKKYDHYFIQDTTTQTLATATLTETTMQPLLTGVLQYKTYGDNVIVYATQDDAKDGNATIKIYQDEQSYAIRQVATSAKYLLDVTSYDGNWYVALASSSDDYVYIYRNPVEHLRQEAVQPAPVEILRIQNPTYVEFSANSQFVMVENGQKVAVFDAENERSYAYTLSHGIDAPQTHVGWMDGYRLGFVSNGLVTIADYDGTNAQQLVAGTATFAPAFDTAYQNLYTIAPATSDKPAGSWQLTSTPLRTAADQ